MSSAESSLRSYDEVATEVLVDHREEDTMALAIAYGDDALRFNWGIVVFGAAFCAWCLVAPATTGRAQSPPLPDATSTMTPDPVPGLLPSYEINKIVRGSGFYPLALPRREGTVYVLRAIDRHDVLMRIVVDARSGAIRAVNRLVSVKTMGVVGTVPASDSAAGDSTVLGSPSSDVMSNSPQQEGTSGLPQSGPQFQDTKPAHTVPADIGGSTIGAEERGLGTLPPSMMPSSKNHAFQGALPLPRPRPSGLEKAKPAPRTHPVKPSAAAASVPSVAPRPAPATERKPPQTASH
jgi:hypothetical protein